MAVGMGLACDAEGAGQRCERTWLAPQCRHNCVPCLACVNPDVAINPRVSNMAKQAKSDLTWTEIDPASLPAEVQEAYAQYKDAYRSMKAARTEFETAINEACSPSAGKRVVCGYNFGKLSIALADAATAPKSSQAKGSLADFLAASQSEGRRS